ncbi:hypothetical protein [Roseiarcus sp.]|uniref:hypothetical protein n=1 Tax=Roseiarcus sp. TaxID=1969460 RepID=UPI003F9DB65B
MVSSLSCTGLGGGHELYCLHNFWKFRRRRKALQSGAEHGVRVGVAAGCAIELCERERGAQFEAAGLLTARDGERGEKRLLGGRIGRTVFDKDFAARAVEFRVEPALPAALEILERMVERGPRRQS